MIAINYRIVFQKGEKERWANASRAQLEDEVIDGSFEIACNDKKYGVYFPEPLWEGETGQFIIDVWIGQFLKAAAHLETASYCAVKDIETPAKWLEMKREGENLLISLAHSEFERQQFVEYKPLPNPQYLDWKDERILFSQFKGEVKKKSEMLLGELKSINPEFLKLPRMVEISELAGKL